MSTRALLIEAANGISGDMFVAAAAGLAKCEAEVLALPGQLGFDDVRCEFRDVVRSSLQCRKFDVLQGERPADTTATEGGRNGYYFNPVREGSEASDERVVNRGTGAEMHFEVVDGVRAKAVGMPARVSDDAHFIMVRLPDVGAEAEVRLRIYKTSWTSICGMWCSYTPQRLAPFGFVRLMAAG